MCSELKVLQRRVSALQRCRAFGMAQNDAQQVRADMHEQLLSPANADRCREDRQASFALRAG